ncbi:MAG: right-handed parallel beta-helix repeat-containing protein, partial [Candidatus Cloacimonetes bacterium]|nr:right-handed parallel beta-helix repeat-containing protein [Candidatus Cloacimonadota bacterium]
MKSKLVLFGFLLVISASLNATIINVPEDQPTIQAGIDVASNGDTVLVHPGTYVENVNYNGKNITVASLFLTTQDSSYISQTIIDGNQDGSVVKFESGEDSTAILIGFTIINGFALSGYTPDGSGGGIFIDNSNPILEHIIIQGNSARYYGGGIYCKDSSPNLENVIINENTAGIYGGGICCWDNSNPSFSNVTISKNTATGWAGGGGGGIFCYYNSSVNFNPNERCNIFLNSAPSGTDLYAEYNCPIINVIVDTFTVLEPNDYFAYPVDNFTFDILNEKLEPVNEDLYVSPTGSNDNSGLSPDDPLLTIYYALLKIVASEEDPHTIHLANGTYSPSQTGEVYPLICKNHVILQGEDQDSTILDGEGLNRILHCPYEYSSIEIENMTIKNGNARKGGGIFCDMYSSPSFNNITISNNYASHRGGGIYCEESNSHPSLTNVTIRGNSAGTGGGIASGCGYPNSLYLSNVTIKDNNAGTGGGIYWVGEDIFFDDNNRCNIYSNTSSNNLGNDLYFEYVYSNIIYVIVDTFTVFYPNDTHAYPIENFSFNILHSYGNNQVNGDLYVAVDGDDSNSGVTPDDPLQTIQCALNIIYADSLHPHSVYVSAGVYSSSTNGESFPVQIHQGSNYVSIIGAENGETILDANHQSRLFTINHLTESTIKNLIILNGTASSGGGIFLNNSSPTFEKITVTNNSASDYGGGIFCSKYSNPEFINTTISENSADFNGGGIYCSYSNPNLVNCILWNDSPDEIYVSTSSSVQVSYSNIQGGWEGEGNIDADPLFADHENGD